MCRLHLHVISQDLCSPCIKHKAHWNSFTTGFFVDADVAIDQITSHGVFHPESLVAGGQGGSRAGGVKEVEEHFFEACIAVPSLSRATSKYSAPEGSSVVLLCPLPWNIAT